MSGIGGIGTSYYNNLMETLGSASGSADKLKDTLDRISAGSEGSGVKKDEASETEDKELMEACKSFESYFIEQVFKGMEKTRMRRKTIIWRILKISSIRITRQAP